MNGDRQIGWLTDSLSREECIKLDSELSPRPEAFSREWIDYLLSQPVERLRAAAGKGARMERAVR